MKQKIGLITGVSEKIRENFERVTKLGFNICQVSSTAEFMIDKLKPKEVIGTAKELGVEIDSFFLLFEGQVWDRFKGPPTMGFVPESTRVKRLDLAKKFSDMVCEMKVKNILSHVGFIPNDPKDSQYAGFINTVRIFAEHCKKNNQTFCFETGQELPSTLKRTILDIGLDNIGINLDPANIILYGMAYPLDAIEILGKYIKGLHAKDGLWPNREDGLGIETPIGEGSVNFPLMISKLKENGFNGPVFIEREISGEQQKIDILKAKTFLEKYL
ncbi:MAG: sugar phosphate isomerase/epimerase [Elusimicrobia bacterium]|nr:sugar phosphate isomerase/epimerase [Elusimicrobiota bacterium]